MKRILKETQRLGDTQRTHYNLNMLKFLDRMGFARLHSMEDILNLSPDAFEYFSKFLLEKNGYESVRVSRKRGPYHADGGVDIEASKDKLRVYGQCKKWKNSQRGGFMPIEQVRALGGSMSRDGVTEGVFISTLPFGKEATNDAKKLHIELIGPERIQSIMQSVNPTFGKKRFSILKCWLFIPQDIKKALEPLVWLALLLLIAFIYRLFL